MYTYSLPILAIGVYLAPYIRSIPPSPIHTLAFAYVYIIDTLINAAFTVAFGVAWFLVLAQHPSDNPGAGIPGGDTIDSTAGFTSPEHNVTNVTVVVAPATGLLAGQDATAHGIPLAARGIKDAMFDRGSIMSITVISILWALRFYACTVILSYARSVLRAHIAATSTSTYSLYHTYDGDSDPDRKVNPDRAPNPFDSSRPEGHGLPGRLGRIMLKVGPDYWLGKDEDADEERWVRGLGGKFNNKTRKDRGDRDQLEPPGVMERERRRRSGTGPPAPPPGLPITPLGTENR